MKTFFCAISIASLVLVGCGGGGDSAASPETPIIFDPGIAGIFVGQIQNGDPNLPSGLLMIEDNGVFAFTGYSGWDNNVYLGEMEQVSTNEPKELQLYAIPFEERTGQTTEVYFEGLANYSNDSISMTIDGIGRGNRSNADFFGTRKTVNSSDLIGSWSNNGESFEIGSDGNMDAPIQIDNLNYCDFFASFDFSTDPVGVDFTLRNCGFEGDYSGVLGLLEDNIGLLVGIEDTLGLVVKIRLFKDGT